jgi:acyl-CoA thioester hydrolase
MVMQHPELVDFPVVVMLAVSWNEMDAFRHVNNVVYFRYFEDARIAYLYRVGWFNLLEDAGIGPIVASTNAKYRRPVKYPDTLLIGARIIAVDSDRVTFEHKIVSSTQGAIVTEGQAVVVCYDYKRQGKCPLPKTLRDAIATLEATQPRQQQQQQQQ